MKRQEIPYRMPDGSTNWQQPGSQAHQLHTEGKTKQLADHMKDVQRHDALAKPCAVPAQVCLGAGCSAGFEAPVPGQETGVTLQES